MNKFLMALVLTFAVSSIGCASTGQQNGTMGGAVVGGAVGAIVGNAVDCRGCALIGGLVGAMAGGYTGGQIGRRMDAYDASRAQRAVNSLPNGAVESWQNPDTNMLYDIKPTRTFKSTSTGDFCREVTIGEAKVGGEREEVYATACRNDDGSWKMQR